MVEPIAATTHGVIRTSSTPLLWSDFARPARDINTGQDHHPVDRRDANGVAQPAGPAVFVGDVSPIEPELAWFARDFRAHPELRSHDPATDSTATVASNELLISYEVDAFTTQGSFGAGIGKMRFTKWNLDWSYPWCAKGSDANGDGVGDDLSDCKFCGDGKLDPLETCDPSVPGNDGFAMSHDTNGNGMLDCGDVAPFLSVLGAQHVSSSSSTPLACSSYCTLSTEACLTRHQCNYDSECGQGQVCECYPSSDDCSCTDKGWTPWMSRDTPNASGDYETVANFAADGQSCAAPTGIACRRKSDGKNASETGEVLTCTPSTGLVCKNAQQADGRCDDYEVRLYCAPTRWFDRDTPNATGDYETLANLRATGDACDHPTGVECRRVADPAHGLAPVDASQTGEVVTCDTTTGFVCKNKSQRDGKCQNYEVRFYCGL